MESMNLIEQMVERKNMLNALERVERNKGAPGCDGMTVSELRPWLKAHWHEVKQALVEGRYTPQPVLRVSIPKPGGKGVRQLGIPTVVDRLIQQALHQVMNPLFDPEFSDSSYGFRIGRSAHHALTAAKQYVQEGRRWVVDMDLEKFFDLVNHDILMSRVARKVKDKRALRLVRSYLQAGIMDEGLVTVPEKGTPQGSPLSPLLSNIILDDLDKELERRGHRFCRYADDCNIYVRSEEAGNRVLASLTKFLNGRLKLKVNQQKSAVARPWHRKFLGYSMTNHRETKLKVAPESLKRFRGDLKALFRRARGRNIGAVIEEELTPRLKGWAAYFKLTEVKGALEELDQWVRRRLRAVLWRQWKRPATRNRKLRARGLSEERVWKSASNGRGTWWNSGASHMNEAFPIRYFTSAGLVSLLAEVYRFTASTRTAV